MSLGYSSLFISNHMHRLDKHLVLNLSFPYRLYAYKDCSHVVLNITDLTGSYKQWFTVRTNTSKNTPVHARVTSHAVNNICHSYTINLMHSAWEAFMLTVPCVPAKSLKTQAPSYVFCRQTLIVNVAKLWLLNFWAAPFVWHFIFSFLE